MHQPNHTDQKAFSLWTREAPASQCQQFNRDALLVLEFQPKDIYDRETRTRAIPPDPTGISGGIAAYVSNGDLRIAAIMTEFWKDPPVMIGSRMCNVYSFARTLLEQGRLKIGQY